MPATSSRFGWTNTTCSRSCIIPLFNKSVIANTSNILCDLPTNFTHSARRWHKREITKSLLLNVLIRNFKVLVNKTIQTPDFHVGMGFFFCLDAGSYGVAYWESDIMSKRLNHHCKFPSTKVFMLIIDMPLSYLECKATRFFELITRKRTWKQESKRKRNHG